MVLEPKAHMQHVLPLAVESTMRSAVWPTSAMSGNPSTSFEVLQVCGSNSDSNDW